MALLRKPAWRASSRDISVKICVPGKPPNVLVSVADKAKAMEGGCQGFGLRNAQAGTHKRKRALPEPLQHRPPGQAAPTCRPARAAGSLVPAQHPLQTLWPKFASQRPCTHLGNDGVGLLQAAPELLVQQEAGKLRSAGPLQELHKDLARWALHQKLSEMHRLKDAGGLDCGRNRTFSSSVAAGRQ